MATTDTDLASGKELCERLKKLLANEEVDDESLRSALQGMTAICIALALDDLKPEDAYRVFPLINESCTAEVLSKINPEYSKEIVKRFAPEQLEKVAEELPGRAASVIVAEAPTGVADEVIANAPHSEVDEEVTSDVESRMPYGDGTAGRLMTQIFVRLRPDMPVSAALEAVRASDPEVDIPNNLYVVEQKDDKKLKHESLRGVISIRDLVMAPPDKLVRDVMATQISAIEATADETDAASLFSKHNFLSLPVVDEDGYFVGVIPADDLMHVVAARLHNRYSQAVGADAAAMEDASPFQAAKMRVPWLMATILLELGAGMVISHFGGVLKRIILLASFMPVISAVSGNVGLQAAAITVRGLDTGEMSLKSRGRALLKEAATSLLMAVACGTVLGIIGLVWSRHILFSVVIGGALVCSMLTAGLMGTIIPMLSKKLGFDPAATAGPFETSFQDIIGFGVFLSLATILLRSMH